MKKHILIGERAVNYFENCEWDKLEELILELKGGDIIAWDNEIDSVSTLLDMLRGWNNFIELSEDDLFEIDNNTKIGIVY